MAITRDKVESLLTSTIQKYGASINWSKYSPTSTVTQSGYDSLYEEVTSKIYLPPVSFSGYPILNVTLEILKANGFDTEDVKISIVTTDALLGPVTGNVQPNSMINDIITFSGVVYQVIGNKPFGYFNPDFVGHWVFAKFFQES